MFPENHFRHEPGINLYLNLPGSANGKSTPMLNQESLPRTFVIRDVKSITVWSKESLRVKYEEQTFP